MGNLQWSGWMNGGGVALEGVRHGGVRLIQFVEYLLGGGFTESDGGDFGVITESGVWMDLQRAAYLLKCD
jgi:hypothetical protein